MKLKNLELHNDEDGYYLSAIYTYETDDGYYEYKIPKILLPVVLSGLPYVTAEYGIPAKFRIDMGFGELYLKGVKDDADGQDYVVRIKCIEKKAKKMTLKEIEEKLGHKIELVSEKKDEPKKETFVKSCIICKHRNLSAGEQPCCECKSYSKWEEKND